MKIRIVKSHLLDGLNIVKGTAAGDLAVLRNVRLTANGGSVALTTTNLDAQVEFRVRTNVLAEGEALLDAGTLTRFMSSMPNGPVEIDTDTGHMARICADEVDYRLAMGELKDFPNMHTPEAHKDGAVPMRMPALTLREMLRKTRFAASQDDTRVTIKGINFELKDGRLTLTATDGRQLATVQHEVDGTPFNVTVPNSIVSLLAKLLAKADSGDVIVWTDGEIICLGGECWTLSSKVVDGAYPDWRRCVPQGQKHSVVVDRRIFALELERVSQVLGDNRAVHIAFNSGEIVFTAQTDRARAKVSMPCKYDGESVKMCLNPDLLKPILACVDEDEVTMYLDDPSKPLTVKCSVPWLAMVMPLRDNG